MYHASLWKTSTHRIITHNAVSPELFDISPLRSIWDLSLASNNEFDPIPPLKPTSHPHSPPTMVASYVLLGNASLRGSSNIHYSAASRVCAKGKRVPCTSSISTITHLNKFFSVQYAEEVLKGHLWLQPMQSVNASLFLWTTVYYIYYSRLRICASLFSWVCYPPHPSLPVHIQLHSSRSLCLFPRYYCEPEF